MGNPRPTADFAATASVSGAHQNTLGRRDLLSGAALTALLTSFAGEARAAQADATSLEKKLVQRITFGMNAAELALVDQLGYDAYLEYHLDHLKIDDSAMDALLAPFLTLQMPAPELFKSTTTISELTYARVLRAIFSKRQLYERVVDFWTDHFNIYILDGDVRYMKPVDDREVVRANALGTFPNMLRASAHSPSMLLYLDNNTNVRTGPNENYARELLELHSLGVDGGYVQADVQEVARCFTGWTFYPRTNTLLRGTFRYNHNVHDTGAKYVLGQSIPAGGGQSDGETVLNILAAHPSTASFIAKKLIAHFWGPYAPQSLVDSVASAYSATNGDIKQMLRTILSQQSLAQAPTKFKRPMHLAASMIRAFEPTVTSVASLSNTHLAGAGHVPFRWIPPDGYPDTEEYWSGLVLGRWNLGFSMLSGQVGGVSSTLSSLTGGATTATAIVDRINARVYAGDMPAKLRQLLVDYMLPNPVTSIRVRDAYGLAMAAAGFQYC